MESETEKKIEETVLEIVKSSNLNETTLTMVLNMATAKLSLDLSQPDRKQFVKQVVHTYLADLLTKAKPKPGKDNSDTVTDRLTKAEPEPDKDDSAADELIKAEPEPDKDDSGVEQLTKAEPEPDEDNSVAKQDKEEPEEETYQKKEPEEENEEKRKRKRDESKAYDDNGNVIICKLSEGRRVTIQDYRLKTLVSIRDYYRRDGKELPTSNGISLTTEQWSALKKNVPALEKAVRDMESRLK